MQNMINRYPSKLVFFGLILLTISLVTSCKKNNVTPAPPTTPVNFATLGLYEASFGSARRVFIPITKIGNQKIAYLAIFDTGSSGMTIDADGILPASMITSTGIQMTGDSVNVNGITVTSQTGQMSYGDNLSTITEYGNLAYATITIGDENGNITTSRIPIFLYYKTMNITTGEKLASHYSDIFGVGPGVNYAMNKVISPLSYFSSKDITSGFKLSMLSSTNFSTTGTYVSGLLNIGLTNSDLAASSGFIMHPLTFDSLGGFSSNIPATITYNGQNIPAAVLFDTGTPVATIIEDKAATSTVGALPVNTVVKVTTNKGFVYQYTTGTTANLTQVQNPNNTFDFRTIFSIDFFVNNEYLVDYKNHRIGLKNN